MTDRSGSADEEPRASVLASTPTARNTRVASLALLACIVLACAIILLMAAIARDWIDNARRIHAAADPAPVARTGPAPARARNPESGFIAVDDYPAASIRANEQGRVSIAWTIGTDGRVHDCHVVQSSGYPRLDAAGCRALTMRARYDPALDAAGRPIASPKTRAIRWVLPED